MLPLEGIKVIEIGGFMAGPVAARHLADMGAEVIKVEHLVTSGDPTRGISIRAFATGQRDTGGFNDVMEVCNRNKRSVALDLRQEQGKEIVHKLVEKADVFITNFPEKTLVEMGLDYDTFAKINPKIIYGIATGWGRRGPDKDKPGFDAAGFAMSGAMAQMAWEGSPPAPLGVRGMGDEITAIILAYGIMVALLYRERTGVGQMVDTSLLGAWAHVSAPMLQQALYSGQDIPLGSRESAGNPAWNCYQTRDGNWVQLAMTQSDPYWHELCQVLDIGEIEDDSRFGSHWQRTENNKALISIFDRAFAKRTLSEWEKRLKKYKIVWTPVYTYAEAVKHPQFWANDYIVKFDHPTYGTIDTFGIAFQLSKTPGAVRRECPQLGQHSEEILLEIGYTWDDMAKLKEQKVII